MVVHSSLHKERKFPAGQGTESRGQSAQVQKPWARRLEGDWCQQVEMLLGPGLTDQGSCSRQEEVRQAGAVRETSLWKGGVGKAFLRKEGCQEAPGGGAAPGRCLTWGAAAALWAAASARVARTQLASTRNPDGSPGAASTTAAFTDVVPRSMPRVTDNGAMAMGSSVGLVVAEAPPLAHLTQNPSAKAGSRLPIPQPHTT